MVYLDNRTQKRLMKKQLKKFSKAFNIFSIFQLETIKKLIEEIIERKKKNERRKEK